MAQPPIKPSVPDQAWLSLEYDLSIQEMACLTNLQSKITAIDWLVMQAERPDRVYAGRLAFQRWLYQTGRLSEFVGAGL